MVFSLRVSIPNKLVESVPVPHGPCLTARREQSCKVLGSPRQTQHSPSSCAEYARAKVLSWIRTSAPSTFLCRLKPQMWGRAHSTLSAASLPATNVQLFPRMQDSMEADCKIHFYSQQFGQRKNFSYSPPWMEQLSQVFRQINQEQFSKELSVQLLWHNMNGMKPCK